MATDGLPTLRPLLSCRRTARERMTSKQDIRSLDHCLPCVLCLHLSYNDGPHEKESFLKYLLKLLKNRAASFGAAVPVSWEKTPASTGVIGNKYKIVTESENHYFILLSWKEPEDEDNHSIVSGFSPFVMCSHKFISFGSSHSPREESFA